LRTARRPSFRLATALISSTAFAKRSSAAERLGSLPRSAEIGFAHVECALRFARITFIDRSQTLRRRRRRVLRTSERRIGPQMHDDRRKNASRLLLCELQCSINCVHVRSCLPIFCLALTVALPLRRATLVLDTDFRLVKSAVRTLPPRKKIIASISARHARRTDEGFIRAGFVPRA
jgi:hypothetical protein